MHFVLCIQETKLGCVDNSVVSSICGKSGYNYSYQPSVGASGGLLFVWDTSEVEVWSTTSIDHFLAIKGQFVQSEKEFVIVNVYAPCDLAKKNIV